MHVVCTVSALAISKKRTWAALGMNYFQNWNVEVCWWSALIMLVLICFSWAWTKTGSHYENYCKKKTTKIHVTILEEENALLQKIAEQTKERSSSSIGYG